MTTIKPNEEPTTLDVIRELLDRGATGAPVAAEKTSPDATDLDPAKLRQETRDNYELVCMAEKNEKIGRLIEGICGKPIQTLKEDLRAALSDLDLIIKDME